MLRCRRSTVTSHDPRNAIWNDRVRRPPQACELARLVDVVTASETARYVCRWRDGGSGSWTGEVFGDWRTVVDAALWNVKLHGRQVIIENNRTGARVASDGGDGRIWKFGSDIEVTS